MNNFRNRQKRYLTFSIVSIIIGLTILVTVFFIGRNSNSGIKIEDYGMAVYDDVPVYQFNYSATLIQYEIDTLDFLTKSSKDERDEFIFNVIKDPSKNGNILQIIDLPMDHGFIERIELMGNGEIIQEDIFGENITMEVWDKSSNYGVYYSNEPFVYEGELIAGGYILVDGRAYSFILPGEDKVLIYPI